MLKNNIVLRTIILLISLIAISSCSSSSGDNISINNFSPDNGAVIYIGDPIAIKANIVSDDNLSSYQIDIYKINNTTSGFKTKKRGVIDNAPFEASMSGSLKGKNINFSKVVDVTLFIGENKNPVEEGNYKLVVTIKDNSNYQVVITRDLIFKNK